MRLKEKVLFISGIDTNIGKTYATAYLMDILKKKGKKVISQKFIQTGCKYRSEDIDKHFELLSQNTPQRELLELTSPIIMSYPASPHLAAKIDNIEIDIERVDEATNKLIEKYGFDHVLMEGAGGLMVPITEDYITIDYIRDRGYPVSLVTSSRLGSINHTLLSIEALYNRDIKIHSIVYNRYPKGDDIIERDTQEYLQKYVEKHLENTYFIVMNEVTNTL